MSCLPSDVYVDISKSIALHLCTFSRIYSVCLFIINIIIKNIAIETRSGRFPLLFSFFFVYIITNISFHFVVMKIPVARLEMVYFCCRY